MDSVVYLPLSLEKKFLDPNDACALGKGGEERDFFFLLRMLIPTAADGVDGQRLKHFVVFWLKPRAKMEDVSDLILIHVVVFAFLITILIVMLILLFCPCKCQSCKLPLRSSVNSSEP